MWLQVPISSLQWEHRFPLILQEIREADADIVCLQELNHFGEGPFCTVHYIHRLQLQLLLGLSSCQHPAVTWHACCSTIPSSWSIIKVPDAMRVSTAVRTTDDAVCLACRLLCACVCAWPCRCAGTEPAATGILLLLQGKAAVTRTEVWISGRWDCSFLQAQPLQLQP